MIKINKPLNQKETTWISENISKWAEVTAIKINDIEIRIYGIYDADHPGGTGSCALYRHPYNVRDAYAYHAKQVSEPTL